MPGGAGRTLIAFLCPYLLVAISQLSGDFVGANNQ